MVGGIPAFFANAVFVHHAVLFFFCFFFWSDLGHIDALFGVVFISVHYHWVSVGEYNDWRLFTLAAADV